MFTYKKAPYKIFALGPKFCWAALMSCLSFTNVFTARTPLHFFTISSPTSMSFACYLASPSPKAHFVNKDRHSLCRSTSKL